MTAKRERRDYLIVSGGVVGFVLYVFRRTLEKQLSRLHDPGTRSYPYDALHDDRLARAFRAWDSGHEALGAFNPVEARTIILQRSAVSVAFTVVIAAVLVALVRRLHTESATGTAKPVLTVPVVLAAGFIVTSATTVLVDLSLVDNPGRAKNPYDSWFPAIEWVQFGCLAALAAVAAWSLLRDASTRWLHYRESPASARLALAFAAGFAGLFNISDIGAQLEDLLRREVATGDLGHDLLRALSMLVAIGCYVLVLKVLGDLDFKPGDIPNAARTAWIGAGIAATGGIVLAIGGQSPLVVLGGLTLAIGWLSMVARDRAFPRRAQLEFRVAGALLIVGVVCLVLGWRLGMKPHDGLLATGVVTTVLGGALLVYRVVRPLRVDGTGHAQPAGPEAAAAVVLLGLVAGKVVPAKEAVGDVGIAIAIVGAVGHMLARRSFVPARPILDAPGVFAVAAGIASSYAQPQSWWGMVAVAAGLVWLRVNRGEDPTVEPPPTQPPQAGDREPTGVLVLAAALPIAAVLTTTFRVLGAKLAVGEEPPFALFALQAGLVGAAFAGGFYITTSAGRQRMQEHADGATPLGVTILAVFASMWLVLALLAVTVWRSVAMDTAKVGPISLLVLTLTASAAASGLMRTRFGSVDQAHVFRLLGFRRTPVIGLLLIWFALVVLVGAPIESIRATSHLARATTPRMTTTPTPRCRADEQQATLRAIKRDAPPHDDAVARELCAWVHDALAYRKAHGQDVGKPLPLILVTASGGGVRAAAWTARVLDCLLFRASVDSDACGGLSRDQRWPYVFAAGGTSGGSIGVATAAAQWLAPVPVSTSRAEDGWARAIAERDHIGPVAGQMLIAEVGAGWLGIVPEHDRAEVLVDSWSQPFGPIDTNRCPLPAHRTIAEAGFLELAATCPDEVPLLLFNGALVRTGGRFDVSPLDLARNGRDHSFGLMDVLCKSGASIEDIRFFDAAFLSARFPFVTPSGRVGYESTNDCVRDVDTAVDVLDGGYYENSGTAQVADLWKSLRGLVRSLDDSRPDGIPPIRPVLLQIENGNVAGAPAGCDRVRGESTIIKTRPTQAKGDRSVRFGEPVRVLWGGWQARIAGEGESPKESLIAAVCGDGHPVVSMGLFEHPGRPLPLGWSLTHELLDDLERVFSLEPNACLARAFVAFVDGTADELARCRSDE